MHLADFLATRPRVPLGTLPTPLDHCPRLSEVDDLLAVQRAADGAHGAHAAQVGVGTT